MTSSNAARLPHEVVPAPDQRTGTAAEWSTYHLARACAYGTPTDDALQEAITNVLSRVLMDRVACEMADALLSGPLAALVDLPRQVHELAETYGFLGSTLHDVPRAETFTEVADDLRALSPDPR